MHLFSHGIKYKRVYILKFWLKIVSLYFTMLQCSYKLIIARIFLIYIYIFFLCNKQASKESWKVVGGECPFSWWKRQSIFEENYKIKHLWKNHESTSNIYQSKPGQFWVHVDFKWVSPTISTSTRLCAIRLLAQRKFITVS